MVRAEVQGPRFQARGHLGAALTAVLVITSLSLGAGAGAAATAAPDRVQPTLSTPTAAGYRDFSYGSGGVLEQSGEKPQSKLWFNDGIWWAVLFNGSQYHIFRLDWSTQSWNDTGVNVDSRAKTKADALWDGSHLYVATAGFSGYGGEITGSASARILRFSYDAPTKAYSVDAGFPVTITTAGMEAIVLAKDTTGKLWVTYTQNNRLMVSRSLTSDLDWGTPFTPAISGTSVDADDISAIVAFETSVGILWSNQIDDAMYWTSHIDGDPDTTWQPTTSAALGPLEADDHINLTSLQADASGRVFAVVKTSKDDAKSPNSNDPLIRVMVLGQNGWGHSVFGRVRDRHTRPILLIDSEHRQMYVFATAPLGGGTIYFKQSSLDDISFAPGLGTPFIQSSDDRYINNATSTKQNLSSATGLIVLASDDTTHFYLHGALSLGGVPVPQPPPPPSPPPPSPPPPGGYASKVLATQGLVSYWRLGERSGTLGADSATAGNAVTYKNVTLGAPGVLTNDSDTAAVFNGSSASGQVQTTASLQITGDVTIEAWVKASAIDANSHTVVGKGTGDSASARQYRLGMSTGTATRWRASVYVGGTSYTVNSTTAPAVGVWQHLVFARIGGTLTLYVNGVAEGSSSLPATALLNTTSGYLGIGKINSSADPQYFPGVLDEVAIYNVGLSAAQVQDHFQSR